MFRKSHYPSTSLSEERLFPPSRNTFYAPANAFFYAQRVVSHEKLPHLSEKGNIERHGKPTTPGAFKAGRSEYLEYMETITSRHIS